MRAAIIAGFIAALASYAVPARAVDFVSDGKPFQTPFCYDITQNAAAAQQLQAYVHAEQGPWASVRRAFFGPARPPELPCVPVTPEELAANQKKLAEEVGRLMEIGLPPRAPSFPAPHTQPAWPPSSGLERQMKEFEEKQRIDVLRSEAEIARAAAVSAHDELETLRSEQALRDQERLDQLDSLRAEHERAIKELRDGLDDMRSQLLHDPVRQ